jgi:hypothetical protein
VRSAAVPTQRGGEAALFPFGESGEKWIDFSVYSVIGSMHPDPSGYLQQRRRDTWHFSTI